MSQKKQNTQWSVQDLMIGVAVLSGFLAIASHMGFNNGFMIVCAVASGILTFVFAVSAPRRMHGPVMATTIVALFLLCNPLLMFFSLVMAINCVGHWFLIAYVKKRQQPLTTLQALYSSALVALLAFCVGVAIGMPGYLEFRKELRQFEPIEISNKLSYEKDFESELPKNLDFENNNTAEYNYSVLQQKSNGFFGRTWALEGIHRRRAERFVKSPGFGVARMLPPTIERATPPELESIGFDEFVHQGGHLQFGRFDNSESAHAERMHETSMFDFVHPDSLGLKVQARKAKGFLSHAFYRSPVALKDPDEVATLKLERLELISLRRFDSARAYKLDHLPRMDQLSSEDVATRELTEFELAALVTLDGRTESLPGSHGDDVSEIVLVQSEEKIEMVGALRAMNACLDCHNAKRYEMLGAFTYHFSHAD